MWEKRSPEDHLAGRRVGDVVATDDNRVLGGISIFLGLLKVLDAVCGRQHPLRVNQRSVAVAGYLESLGRLSEVVKNLYRRCPGVDGGFHASDDVGARLAD